jgi:hypothetical protein
MVSDPWEDLVRRNEGGAVTRGKMFGCEGLRTGRKFFTIRWHEQLVVKLPADRLAEVIAAGQGEPFEPMEGRRMNGWTVLGDSADRSGLVEEARAYVETQNA